VQQCSSFVFNRMFVFHLFSLEIGFNMFEGTLPSELGKMSQLERFIAPFNFFRGPIPDEMGRMEYLAEVNLTANL
jgi:hypothetical protein